MFFLPFPIPTGHDGTPNPVYYPHLAWIDTKYVRAGGVLHNKQEIMRNGSFGGSQVGDLHAFILIAHAGYVANSSQLHSTAVFTP